MARPKKQETEKRTNKMTVVFTDLELKAVLERSDSCQLKPSIWIRKAALDRKPPESRIPKIDVQTLLELKKIGTNINQIAKEINTGDFLNLIKINPKSLNELRELVNIIISRLR